MSFLGKLKAFFKRLFNPDPVEAKKRKDMARVHQVLSLARPAVYKLSTKQVLPSFALSVFHFRQVLRPIVEIVWRTIGSSDARQSQRFYDYLIDCHLSERDRQLRHSLVYESMAGRALAAVDPKVEIAAMRSEFDAFLKTLSGPQMLMHEKDLADMVRLVELCKHDFERLLGLFDPGVNVDDPAYKPDFAPVAGESIAPELIDFYYVFADFEFTPAIEENLSILLERVNPPGEKNESRRGKLHKFMLTLNKMMDIQLTPELVINLLRAVKEDPAYVGEHSRPESGFLASYRGRLSAQFSHDIDRIQLERHETAIQSDIKALFGEREIMEVEGYNEENSESLHAESPECFDYVRQMRIIKTFIYLIFEAGGVKEAVKRLLVEGFFEDKSFQNNLANVFFQCEHAARRFEAFEASLTGNGRNSVIALRRYLDESKKGKDIQVFVNRLATAINSQARELLENESTFFGMLGDALAEIMQDFKRPSPELISNIRAIGVAKNRELINAVNAASTATGYLSRIMHNFKPTGGADPGAPDLPLD